MQPVHGFYLSPLSRGWRREIRGWGHQFDLHIVIDPHVPGQVLAMINVTIDEVLGEMKDVFCEKLGVMKGYTHQIVLEKGTIPVKHKVRRVPVVVRAEVKKLLDYLLREGVIEPVE